MSPYNGTAKLLKRARARRSIPRTAVLVSFQTFASPFVLSGISVRRASRSFAYYYCASSCSRLSAAIVIVVSPLWAKSRFFSVAYLQPNSKSTQFTEWTWFSRSNNSVVSAAVLPGCRRSAVVCDRISKTALDICDASSSSSSSSFSWETSHIRFLCCQLFVYCVREHRSWWPKRARHLGRHQRDIAIDRIVRACICT